MAVTYLYQKTDGGTYYFRRGIPKGIRHYFNGKQHILKSLQTRDKSIALKQVQYIAKQVDDQFTQLQGTSLADKAAQHLAKLGLQAKPIQDQHENILTAKIDVFGNAETTLVENFNPTTPEEKRAFDILNNKQPILLSEALTRALNAATDKDKQTELKRSFKFVKSLTHQDDIQRIDHFHLQDKIDLTTSPSHRTIRRYISLVRRAVDQHIKRSRRRDIKSPFVDLVFNVKPAANNDAKTLAPATIKAIETQVQSLKAEPEMLIAALINTGARISEIAGLMQSDIHLDHEIPHISIRANQCRTLKTRSSERLVPLFGIALVAIKQAASKSNTDYLFPRWLDANGKLKRAVPANAVRYNLAPHNASSHDFRHTLNARMIEAGIYQEIRNFWFGWSGSNMASYYGKPEALRRLKDAADTLTAFLAFDEPAKQGITLRTKEQSKARQIIEASLKSNS